MYFYFFGEEGFIPSLPKNSDFPGIASDNEFISQIETRTTCKLRNLTKLESDNINIEKSISKRLKVISFTFL